MIKSKFKATFSNEKTTASSKALLKYINKKAPKGYEYKLISPNSETYSLRKNKSQDVSFLARFKFPMIFEGIKVKNIQDLLELSYRAQKEIVLDENLQRGINGQPPTLISLTGEIDKQTIFPMPFPELEPLKLYWKENTLEIPFKRIPFPDLNKSKYESVGNNILEISFSLDERNDKVQLNANINFEYLKTIDDYFRFRDFLKSYSEGKVKIFSDKLALRSEDISEKIEIFEKNDKLYSALQMIQNEINDIIPFPQKLSVKEINEIKILFESYINDRVIKFESQPNIKFTFNDSSNFKDAFPKSDNEQNMGIFVPLQKNIKFLSLSIPVIENQLYTNTKLKELKLEDNILVLQPNKNNESFVYYQKPEGYKDISFDEMLAKKSSAIELKDVDFSVLEK